MNTKIDYPNGDIYIGDVDENGLPHGKGVKRYKQQSYGKWLGYQVCYKEYKGRFADRLLRQPLCLHKGILLLMSW